MSPITYRKPHLGKGQPAIVHPNKKFGKSPIQPATVKASLPTPPCDIAYLRIWYAGIRKAWIRDSRDLLFSEFIEWYLLNCTPLDPSDA